MGEDWRSDLEHWLEPYLRDPGNKTRRRVCPACIAGLIGPGDRKSIQPMAARADALTALPALTLATNHEDGTDYDYGRAFRAAAELLFDERLATMLATDLASFQDVGLDTGNAETGLDRRSRRLVRSRLLRGLAGDVFERGL